MRTSFLTRLRRIVCSLVTDVVFPFGSPGSVLDLDLHDILFAGFAPGQTNRSRRLTFPLANDPRLIGQPMFFQWQLATSDTGIPAGWVTSNRAGCVIL